MKFAHLGDCHLGGWRIPELNELNFHAFKTALEICIKEKVGFVLMAGDLFDSACPPIDTLKETFREFRRLKESRIPVFLISGSHDYSVSGKTFLDVLAKAGFCFNVEKYEERNGSLLLEPTIYNNVAIYGYPGKKSGLEVDEIGRIKLQDSPGMFKILMLHTALRDAVGSLPIKSVDQNKLPKVDYTALAHLHIKYNKQGRVYSGPLFPNSITELEELKGGSFYIFNNGEISRREIKPKEVLAFNFDISDSLKATDEILSHLGKSDLKDKIVIVRLKGMLNKGKTSDIDFQKIESIAREKGAFTFLRSTSKLLMSEPEIQLEAVDSENLEQQIIKNFVEQNPDKFNDLITELMKSLQTEKQEDEKVAIFEERLISEVKKVIKHE